MRILPLTFVLVALAAGLATAQKPRERFYRTGQVSSRETPVTWPGDNSGNFKQERVQVFNIKGDNVFEGHRRSFGGHATVDLQYHPNGGVSRIEVSEAPDAGIQWYRARYTLDAEGNITDKQEQSHDDRTTLTVPGPAVQPVPRPQPPRPDACAVPMQTQIVLHNLQRVPHELRLVGLYGTVNGREYVQMIGPGQQLVSHQLTMAERFLQPEEMFELYQRNPATGQWVRLPFGTIPMRILSGGPQVRTYEFYWLEGL